MRGSKPRTPLRVIAGPVGAPTAVRGRGGWYDWARKADHSPMRLRGRISAPILMRLLSPAQSTATGNPPPNGRRLCYLGT
jgi:hypothetical protein